MGSPARDRRERAFLAIWIVENCHRLQRPAHLPGLTRRPEFVLKGATTYTAKVTDTALGTIRPLSTQSSTSKNWSSGPAIPQFKVSKD